MDLIDDRVLVPKHIPFERHLAVLFAPYDAAVAIIVIYNREPFEVSDHRS